MDISKAIKSLFLGLTVMGALAVVQAALAAPVFQEVNGITKATLDNGLRVMVKENPTNNVVAMYALLDCGTAYDPEGKAGLSHIMQQLITKGTKTRSSYGISLDTESVGASVGASSGPDNGGVYCLTTVAGLERASDVFFDIIRNPTFPEAELGMEKSRAIYTLQAMGDDPMQAALLAYLETFYAGQVYGRQIPGKPQDIAGITRDDVVKWKDRVYNPANMVISVVGRVKATDIVALVDKNLGDLRVPADPIGELPPSTPPKEPKMAGMTKETQASWVLVGYNAPTYTDPDLPAMDVLNNIVGGSSFGTRLFTELRVKQGLAYAAFSACITMEKANTLLGVVATNPQAVEAVKAGMLGEFEKLKSEPISPEELQASKDYTLGARLMGKETNLSVAGSIGVNELYAPGRDLDSEYLKGVKAVTPEKIMELSRKYFVNPTVFVLNPGQ